MYARAQEAEKRCFADNCAAASRMTEGSVREDIYRRLARFTVGLAHLLCLAHMLFPAAAAEPRVCIRYGTGYGATWHAYTVYRLILRINTASIPDVAVLTASTVLKMLQSNHHLTEPPVRFFGADRTCS